MLAITIPAWAMPRCLRTVANCGLCSIAPAKASASVMNGGHAPIGWRIHLAAAVALPWRARPAGFAPVHPGRRFGAHRRRVQDQAEQPQQNPHTPRGIPPRGMSHDCIRYISYPRWHVTLGVSNFPRFSATWDLPSTSSAALPIITPISYREKDAKSY